MLERFRQIALTLPGRIDPAIAIAAGRAGELGVLNLEYSRDTAAARDAIARLAGYARKACGIKLDGRDGRFIANVTSDLPQEVQVVILTPTEPEQLRELVQALHHQNLTVLLECTSAKQASLGVESGVDGLIAKGHEAGGWVGEETTFILLQSLLAKFDLPVWAQGGIGLHTAAASYAAGASGVVLDAQLALTRESLLPQAVKDVIARMDGSETVCLGAELGAACRVYNRPGLPALETLREVKDNLREDSRPRSLVETAWRNAVAEHVGWGSPEQHIWVLGQDAAFATPLAEQFHTVGGVLTAIRRAVDEHIRAAAALQPLREHNPLAQSHGTAYPIVQGPMTRVSDRAEFALRVAEGGALPFLALALMRGPEVEALLRETRELLGERPWGVGILGFVPLDLRQEQLAAIRAYRPPFALIAGGRPDQARSLEEEGIPTYLHVPSPGLLRMFLHDGARRFVFEGRECGGHVGPRSSFVLWNTMIDVLLDELPARDAEACHVLFAGGIHDAVSASMVATMAAPLVQRGARVGVLLGTSYLFTEEAVAAGAILPGYQEEAVHCDHTVLVETGPGHVIRCAETTYVSLFEQEKQRLMEETKPAEEIREALEALNVGRLRIASKGIDRHPRYGQDPDVPKYVTVEEKEQHRQGMYMIGQLAALRDQICTIKELHHGISIASTARLVALSEESHPIFSPVARPFEERPSDIAIVGMATLLPKAPNLLTYWENILNKIDAVTEVPADRWDWERYYDPDRNARDKVYSKWGGFLDEIPFDPTRYGIPPNALRSIEPVQLLTLEVVRAALEDAGYLDRPFARERTSIILGAGGGVGDLGQRYFVRSSLPSLMEEVPSEILEQLPEWTEDSFPGILLNVIAGRVANRFDFGGVNYVVDAACASSLAALYQATRELELGTSDVAIAGGVENVQNPFAYLAFSKTQALSPGGHCRTFDDEADGIAISEGLAVVVLKRLADAERDGDRIYAVVKGVAGSSDGRDRSLTAPRPQGQALALERAYAKAGISPATVGLIEAHGTGTAVGDQAEVETLQQVFGAAKVDGQRCALGSVKSMIGHTKNAAGTAGLIKVALALHHKVLPPTLGVDKPNSKARFHDSPFYVNTETRPWINGVGDHPRRAGVSAFGFGGTNFHAVVEEYTGDFLPPQATVQHWSSELCLWSASSRQELIEVLASLDHALEQGAKPKLADLAYSLYKISNLQSPISNLRLAIVATSLGDLRQKLGQAREALNATGPVELKDPRGIYYTEKPLARDGRVAFLFPGQGSQYPDMLNDLAVVFPEIRETFERADRALVGRLAQPLSGYVFPPPALSPEEKQAQQDALTQTNVAQPALGAADMAVFRLLQAFGIQPDMVAGHSYGEYVALCVAGAMDEETLFELSEARGRSIIEAAQEDLGTMAAVRANPEDIAPVLESVAGVWIANLNAPEQTIISGTQAGVAEAVDRLQASGIGARPIEVACAFHSPLVAPAQQRLADVLSRVSFANATVEVFSNMTAAPYPEDADKTATLLADHLVNPVRFTDEIEAMYLAGARLFIEVGPRNILTGLVGRILGERAHLAINVDLPQQPSLTRLQHALAQLVVQGVAVRLDRLFQGRTVRQHNLDRLVEQTTSEPLSPTTWMVSGGRVRPKDEPSGPPYLPVKLDTAAKVQGAERAPAQQQEFKMPNGKRNPAQPASHSAPPAPQLPVAPAQDGADNVMVQFQHLMDRFLETQRNIMLTYLGSHNSQGEAPRDAGRTQESKLRRSNNGMNNGRSEAQTVVQPSGQSRSQPAVAGGGEIETEAGTPQPALNADGRLDGGLDREALTQHLLTIVAERTGYPTDMLDMDLDLEANLGIDSIKRVEIVGQLRRFLVDAGWNTQDLNMEGLAELKTLRQIIDRVVDGPPIADDASQAANSEWPASAHPPTSEQSLRGIGGINDGQRSAPADDSRSVDHQPPSAVQRSVLRVVDRPLADTLPAELAPGRTVIITDDGMGVARQLTQRLRNAGHPVVVIQQEGFEPADFEVPTLSLRGSDLVSEDALEHVVAEVRSTYGPIAALIHLLPLRAAPTLEEMDLPAWRERLTMEMGSLFLLSKVLRQNLESAAENGGAALIAASGMGGTFAVGPDSDAAFFPGQGSVAGFLKTVAKEWPTIRVKTVDLNPQENPGVLAGHLLAELRAGDNLPEIGYRDGRRLVLEPVLSVLPTSDDPKSETRHPTSDWVLLVTGGARGITADVALELAERYQSRLVLVGRSPLPPPEEAPDTVGLTEPRELKAALIERFRSQGEPVSPAQVEANYQRLLKEREMRYNISLLERAGAPVHYYSVDVRDEQAFGALIDEIYETFGRLDGVIHGAGINEDKLVKDKTLDSFDRVFSTKADSAFVLSQHLRPESLRFLVFFSSVAGRFGNRGQADYAAANQVLSKLAVYLDRRWPARVVSIDWGPWENRGMVSPELQREFARRGVTLVPSGIGRRMLDEEIRFGRKGEAEIIVGGSVDRL